MAQNTERSMNEEFSTGQVAGTYKSLCPEWSTNVDKSRARFRAGMLSPEIYGTITDRAALDPFDGVPLPKGTA